jgi:putative peptidoglycan lipid II flippase
MSGQAVRNSALLSLAALSSRLLGWVRLIVLVGAFGADGRLDPYLAAFKIPDIIYQLIAAGPLSSVLVPLLVRLRSEGDELRARRIVTAIFLIFGVMALLIAVLALALANGLSELLAPGISASQREEVAQLSRILAPSSLGLGLVAVASVWSAASERFFASSIGPIVYNLAVILFTLFGAERFGTTAAALGTVVGALLFALIALLDARLGGLRLARPSLKDALLLQSLAALLPRIGGLLAVQIVLTGLVALASTLGSGSITAWTYALSLVQLPLAMVAGSIGTAILPVAARVLHLEGPVGLMRVTRTALGAAVWMLLPVAVIGAVLATNPVGLVLGISPTSAVGSLLFAALSLLLLSLPIQGATSVATRLCYGAGDTRGPVGSSVAGSVVMALTAAPLVTAFGFGGLAFAVLLGETLECGVLLVRLRGHLGGSLFKELFSMTASALITSIGALLIALLLSRTGSTLFPTASLAPHALIDAAAALGGLFAYVLLSAKFQLPGSTAPLAALTRMRASLSQRVGGGR